MRERKKGRTQEKSAASANLRSRKTVAKYEGLEKLPSELKQPRRHRTRQDPFKEDWPAVERMLGDAPNLEAKALFEWLCEQQSGGYQPGQLRSFQRHVATCRALNRDQIAILEQIHHRGEVLQTDGTWLTGLGVAIQGLPFKPVLIHSVLPYSNWEWGRIAQSESLAALRLGLGSTVVKLGHVPKFHQTDNSSAATYRPGAKTQTQTGQIREYTDGYLQLLAQYGLKPRTTNINSPQENGDVESSHGRLKRALEQYLLLRGSRDFDGIELFEDFLFDVMERRNRPRQTGLAEELAVMKPLSATALATSVLVQTELDKCLP